MNKVTLHSLYMDRGETLDYALESVKRMSLQQPSEYFYDILCTPDQIELAGKYLTIITKEIKKLNPQLIDETMFFGVTTNEDIRPAAMTLAMRMKDQPNPPFLDINPKRPPR